MNNTDLKKCPFCGADAKIWRTNYQVYIECSKSDCDRHDRHLIQVSASTEEEAIKAWNTRKGD
jgi:Lar family restriction alleviation protein